MIVNKLHVHLNARAAEHATSCAMKYSNQTTATICTFDIAKLERANIIQRNNCHNSLVKGNKLKVLEKRDVMLET